MPVFGEVASGSLSQQVRDMLIQQIINGARSPGERLKVVELADEFGTSQSPIREALRDLSSIRLVEIKPRRGTFVQAFVQQTMQESYVVRAALEEAATRAVLDSGTLPIEELKREIDVMESAAQSEDLEKATLATVEFHRQI